MRKGAVFIDGSNLIGNLQKRGSSAFIDIRYLAEKLVSADRLVYLLYGFSSPHPKVPENIRRDQQRYHDMLRMMSEITVGEGWRPPPHYEEKGVDVIIAINMVSMACNDNYDVAYLVSGDSDLAPAVEMVRRIGKEVVFVYFWDRKRPKHQRRFSHRLARAASSKIGFKKKWARAIKWE